MRAKTAQTNNHRFIVETESVPELLIDSVSLNDSTTLYHDRQNPHNGKALVPIMSSVWLYVRSGWTWQAQICANPSVTKDGHDFFHRE